MVVGLIKGRHALPPHVAQYIWEGDIKCVSDIAGLESYADVWVTGHNPKTLTVYVTGLSQALVAVINACHRHGVDLTLMHYDLRTKQYLPQSVE